MLTFENFLLKNNSQLTEANNYYRDDNIVTGVENRFKKDLSTLLAKQGYNRYKKRLEAFNIRILFPGDPEFDQITTAAISFDDMTIYVNAGMLNLDYYKKHGNFKEFGDINKGQYNFEQMSMLIRHELSHNLLMHQIRMIKKLSDKFPELKLRTSSSLHKLLNILEDFEISNKRYTDKDKELVRHTYLNGCFISGLVTEDHRGDWAKMSLEDMYDAIKAEIYDIENVNSKANKFKSGYGPYGALGKDSDWWGKPDYNAVLTQASTEVNAYKNKMDESSIYDFNELNQTINYVKSINPELGKSFETIANSLKATIVDDKNTAYTQQDIEKFITAVQDSAFDETVDLINNNTGEVICEHITTPEEKMFTIEVLNLILGKTPYNNDYKIWKEQIEKHIDPQEFSEDELKELIDIVSKNASSN